MNILDVKNLSKKFGGIEAIADLSFSLREGTITSVIGPNGAGKTTLFNLLTKCILPDDGFVYHRGRDTAKLSPHQIANLGIGRLFQDIRIFDKLTVLENLLVACKNNSGENPVISLLFRTRVAKIEKRNLENALKWLEFVGLSEMKNTLAENLSYGQQKLLSLARLLANDADLLLLDEPVSGIHPEMVDQILSLIRKIAESERKTVLLIEHNIGAVLKVSDWVMLLDSGRLVAFGLPDEIREDRNLKEVYLGA